MSCIGGGVVMSSCYASRSLFGMLPYFLPFSLREKALVISICDPGSSTLFLQHYFFPALLFFSTLFSALFFFSTLCHRDQMQQLQGGRVFVD
jgi:hypothetical protein